jgi:ABC-2 type transport system ATP-binding protein
VGIMSAGNLLQQGPLEAVLGTAGRVVTVTSARPADAATTLQLLGITGIAIDAPGGSVSGTLNEVAPEKIGPALVQANVEFTGLAVARPALEDFFVTLTGEGFDVAG